MPPRTQTQRTQISGFSIFPHSLTTATEKNKSSLVQIYNHPVDGNHEVEEQTPEKHSNYGQLWVSLGDLQKIEHIEEKAHETALVLKTSINVIS